MDDNTALLRQYYQRKPHMVTPEAARILADQPPATEEEEHLLVAAELDRLMPGEWCHVPNGGSRHPAEAAKLKRMGVEPGIPDFLIFRRPPRHPQASGCAIELKRRTGGRLSPQQRQAMAMLVDNGWAVHRANGYEDAVRVLREEGYLS